MGLYTEGFDEEFLRPFAAVSGAVCTIIIANMQRQLLLLGVDQLIVRTRITVLVIVALLAILFGQRLIPQIPVWLDLASVNRFSPFVWLIALAYAAFSTIVTGRQIMSRDTVHV